MAGHSRDAEFTDYVTARSAWLRKVAYLLSGDWHRADDLVQATIIKLYMRWPRINPLENIDGYARTTLVNTFLAEQRKPWARRVVLRDAGTEAPEQAGDLDAALDLRSALDALPPRQRATVVLRYYCDLPVEEVATVLSCSEGTVKSQSARGLDALRRILQSPIVTSMSSSGSQS
jgi:RNA polymerase sigma-70 factor (sigma-E family)